MKYFIDAEFIEDGRTIDLISIGIVCEDECEYCAVSSECKFEYASDWVWQNVLYPIGIYQPLRYINPSDPDISAMTEYTLRCAKSRAQIKEDLMIFLRAGLLTHLKTNH